MIILSSFSSGRKGSLPREVGESFPWRHIILSHLELSAMYSGEFILGTIPSPYIQQWQGLDML